MKRIIAMALAIALSCGLFATAAFAEESATSSQAASSQAVSPEEESAPAPEDTEDAPPEAEDPAGETEEAGSPAGPDPEPGAAPEQAVVPDKAGAVSFANVERRIRENNLQILALEENIKALEEIDYEDLQADLRKTLNKIAKGQEMLLNVGQGSSYSYTQLEQTYTAIKEQFDAIKDGDLQEDNAGIVRQLENLQDQIVMAGEATYVALAAMESQEASLQRQLTAMDRTVEEMELRYQLGQISALQLSQVRTGRTSLSSGLETLRMNIQTYKSQLELLLGAEITGEISLGPVPAVTEKQLAAMDLEADLAAAKEKSYELYAAAQTLKDAEEEYKDTGKKYNYDRKNPTFNAAYHSWQAAPYTYNNTVQSYELKFRTLYAQVNDYQQIWAAAKVSLESQKLSAAASELKYQQGTISYNALLDARDELTAAEEAVQSAASDLFSSYNTYCWAVQHGILN